MRQQGIVLKNYQPKKQKIALLDAVFGRIECFAFQQPLHAGTLISYIPARSGYIYRLEGAEILEVPLQLARYELYFLHHILELCYYFLPLDATADTIFELVFFVLNSYPLLKKSDQKSLFLLRFFIALGMYPEKEFGLSAVVHYLLSQPIDVMLREKVQIPKQALERWLLSCIETHPQKAQFKTMVVGCDNDI